MFEAYKIGVRIGVVDATAGGIIKIAGQFAKAQKEASAFLLTLRKVNEELRRSQRGWANNAAEGFRNARREADAYAGSAARAAASGGLVPASSFSGSRSSGSVGRLGGPGQRGIGYSGGGAGLVAMAAFAGGRGGSGGGGRLGGGGMLALPGASGGSMGSGSANGRMATAGWFGGGGGGRRGGGGGSNSGSYGAMGKIIGGAMVERGGQDMLGMLGGPIDEAMKYQQAVTKFTLYGNGDKLNADAVKFAKGMNIVGTSMTDAMEHMVEAQGVFRESGLTGSKALEGAKLAAPMLAKMAFATSGLDGDTQAKMHTSSLAMLRFVEMRGGLKDAATFNGIADAGWKAVRSSGGNVSWEQLRQFMARGGVAAQGLSNTSLFGMLEPVIGELKGSTAGNAWMTSYNRLVGGVRIPNQVAHLLADNGIWDQSKIEWNSMGGIKQFRGNPLRDMKTFASDPVTFYEKNILPMYAKMGINTATDRGRENTMIFGRTGGAMFSLIDRQRDAIHRSVTAQQKTLGIDASVSEVGDTARGQLIAYHAQINTLQTQLGLVILPMMIRGLKWLNPMLQKMGDWIGAHSTLTKGLVILFASVAGLAIVGGSLVAIAGGFTLISSAITAGGGLGVMIGGVGRAMTALTGTLGVFMAAYAGWKAGGLINDEFINPAVAKSTGNKYDTVGTALSDFTHPFNPKTGKREFSAGRMFHWAVSSDPNALMGSVLPADRAAEGQYMQRGSNKPIQVNAQINLDGQKVGESVSTHQAKALTRPQIGMSSFDSSQSGVPMGLNGAF